MSTNEEKKEQAVSWLTSLLTGWGIKQSWAQYIAAAIIGAVAAVLMMTQTSCTTTASQGADGSWSYTGELIAPITTVDDDEIIIKELNGDEK